MDPTLLCVSGLSVGLYFGAIGAVIHMIINAFKSWTLGET